MSETHFCGPDCETCEPIQNPMNQYKTYEPMQTGPTLMYTCVGCAYHTPVSGRCGDTDYQCLHPKLAKAQFVPYSNETPGWCPVLTAMQPEKRTTGLMGWAD